MYKTVMTFELEQLMKKQKLNIIDVREQDEVDNGHIKGIIHMPLSSFGRHLNKINKNDEYYVICYSGARSTQAAQFLANQGYKVTNVMGGMSIYQVELVYEV
ncbi:rhodanese-like domain-containing protein [Acholeplasma hippikon]|nr:rhodanese-like domain-containing protein [Acholeplasma hippikon]